MMFKLAMFDAGGRQVGAHVLDCGDHVLAAAEAAGLLRRAPDFRHATLTQDDWVVARFPGPVRPYARPPRWNKPI
jgi:hypothetical protein